MKFKNALNCILNWMRSFTTHANPANSATQEDESRKYSSNWFQQLAPPTGWHLETDENVHFWVPDGSIFSDAETVIFVKAFSKARAQKVMSLKSIQDVINNDIKVFRKNAPGVEIQEAEPLPIANGEMLRSLTFIHTQPGNDQNWDRVTYGEDATQGEEVFMLFTLTSRSLAGYTAAQEIYQTMLQSFAKNYRHKRQLET